MIVKGMVNAVVMQNQVTNLNLDDLDLDLGQIGGTVLWAARLRAF